MSLEDFQFIDNEPIDNYTNKRECLKVYHHQSALLNDHDQNVEFIFGENNKYHQVGNSHLGFDITVRKADGNNFNFTNDPATNEMIRLVNNAFAYCFKERTMSTTGGIEIEQVKLLGQVSTIMTALTSKGGELLSHFDNIDETQNAINNFPLKLKQMLITNHTQASQGKIKSLLPIEHKFGFCKTFKKITKNLGFQLAFKTNVLQDFIFTTLADDINVTIINLYLFVPVLISNAETQLIFNESVKNIYTISYDSCY